MRVLLVEDDTDLATTLCEELGSFYAVDVAKTGKLAAYQAEINPYDTIVLDIGLPDMNGIDLCTFLRKKQITTPILMLTGRAGVEDKVDALHSGADDYLTKPFQTEELLARINALIRRNNNAIIKNVLTVGCLHLDPVNRTVFYEKVPLNLRRKEFDLLEFLIRNQPNVVSREMILDHVWDSNVNSFTNAIDVHISRLRDQIDKRFDTQMIETVYGFGYRINPPTWVEPLPTNSGDS